MWYHGIYLSLEVLRRRGTGTVIFMLSFIDMAYEMLRGFNDNILDFKPTWMEILGDLARYSSALRGDGDSKRQWSRVAESWYFAAANQVPIVGRLYHQLAIVARMLDQSALQQYYLFSRSLNCVISYSETRESLKPCLLDRILEPEVSRYPEFRPSINIDFIKVHAHLLGNNIDAADKSKLDFINKLNIHIHHSDITWNEDGVRIACINIASWFNDGSGNNVLCKIFLTDMPERYKDSLVTSTNYPISALMASQVPREPSISKQTLLAEVQKLTETPSFTRARDLTTETLSLVLRRTEDESVLPHVHIVLSFCTQVAASLLTSPMLNSMPWTELCALLNILTNWKNQQVWHHDITTTLSFFTTDSGDGSDEIPLPEDYQIRGLVWAGNYFPDGYFAKECDEEERYVEQKDTLRRRRLRILRLGHELAKVYRFLLSYLTTINSFRLRIPPQSFVVSSCSLYMCPLTFNQHKQWIVYESHVDTFSVLSTACSSCKTL
jgi:hypothetical protein